MSDHISHDADRRYEYTDGLEILQEAKNYNGFLRDLIRSACPTPTTHALDFGAGIGTFSEALSGLADHVTCIEIDSVHRAVLEECGLPVASLPEIAPASVDYVYSVHHLLKYNARRPMPRLARWFDPLTGLPALIGFTAFDTARRLLGLRTSALLMVARKT